MPTPIHFGTDGWRAIIAEDFTFDNVRRLSQALAHYLLSQQIASKGLVIGYDQRFASEDFARAVAEVMAGNGIPVSFCEQSCPSPTVAYAVLPRQAAGAVVITASHNSARYNGFKLKSQYGAAAPPEMVKSVEALLDQSPVQRKDFELSCQSGLITRFNPFDAYQEQLVSLVNLERIRQAGLTIISDPMYGAGIGYLPALLNGGSSRVVEIHGERNPIFPGMKNPEPLAHNLGKLCAVVRDSGSDVGIAFDGDADRLGLVDERGNFVDPLRVFALLTLYLLEVRGRRGPIVKSISSTAMVDKLAERYRLPVFETPVGFKYIGTKMVQEDALIGGEESGGYGFRQHIPERDGVLAALFLLDMMVRLEKTPSELVEHLFEQVGEYHYARIDMHRSAGTAEMLADLHQGVPPTLLGQEVQANLGEHGFKYVLADGSWLLIRPSGTEPLLRLYAESGTTERVQALLQAGQEMLGLRTPEPATPPGKEQAGV
ncbi:MAG: phosphoglucomutase/phosphomannomutase family protein [Chloroflexia bacterium]|nr:phosphoglucomutase/phosphomannomutase family protein [Chloroflexia bacterium]